MKTTKKLKAKTKKSTPRVTPAATPVRKIVQIAVNEVPGLGLTYTALADDGSLWHGMPGKWDQCDVDGVIYDTPPPPPPAAEPVPAEPVP